MNTISIQSSSVRTISIAALQILGFTALTAVCAQIRIPLPGNPVPITLQSLAVILSGAILGSRRGAISQILLVALGMSGFSVFSQALPGNLVLLGPTGGYILGFVFAAFVTGRIFENQAKRSFMANFLYLFIASLFIFVPGVVWLKNFTGQSFAQAIMLGFVPFLFGDIVKTFMAALFLSGYQRLHAAKNSA